MFKKGDKITPKKSQKNHTSYKHGETLTIDSINGYSFRSKCGYEGDCHNWELVAEEKKEENKMKVNYHVLNSSVVLNYAGRTETISNEDDRFDKVIKCISDSRLDEKRLQDIPEIVEVERRFNGEGIELKNGLLYIKDVPMPIELSDRILKFREQKLSYDYLLKFWENVKLNPSFNSRNMLFKFLEHNGHPLTQDGCFIAYRGVTNDFKDCHSKSFDNSVGSVCEVPRESVDDNPNNTCSYGLHVACHNYAKGFGPKLITVKVNPKDVVAVPTDYNGTKMRVCRFEVIEECEKEHTDVQVYHEETNDCEENHCSLCGSNFCGGECMEDDNDEGSWE